MIDPDGKRLYDTNDNEITYNEAFEIVKNNIRKLYSGDNFGVRAGFSAKPELSDIWDFKSWGVWSYGGTGFDGVITAGSLDVYECDPTKNKDAYYSNMKTTWISTFSQGFWSVVQVLPEVIGYSANGEEVIQLQIYDAEGNLVFEFTHTIKKVNDFLSTFNRNYQNAFIKYNKEGEAIEYQIDPYDELSDDDSGWEAEYQNSPR